MRSIVVPLLAILCAACGPRAVPEPPDPAPAPPSLRLPAPAASRHPPPPAEVCRCIRICVVQRGRLFEVPVRYNTATGDTLTEDLLPFSHVYPVTGEYAVVAGWYVNREPIRFRGRPYVLYSRPRVLGTNEVARVGEYRGVGVYAEATDPASAARVVYLPSRPGCEFQPYVNADSLARFPR